MDPGGLTKEIERLKEEILGIPRALTRTLTEAKPVIEELVRQVRWEEGPIYVVGEGPARLVGIGGRFALESLLGWPVVVRSAKELENYSAPLRRHSLVLVVSSPIDSQAMVETARKLKREGATILALTEDSSSELAQVAEGLIPVWSGETRGLGIRSILCRQFSLGLFALAAAQKLKAPRPEFDTLQEELAKLPQQVEKLIHEQGDAPRMLGEKLKQARSLMILAGGFFYPVALLWADSLKKYAEIQVEVSDLLELDADPFDWLRERIHPVVILSGSRSKLLTELPNLAAQMDNALCEMVVVSDNQDRILIKHSTMALLIPTMSEMVAAMAMLAPLQLAGYYAARRREGESGPRRR